MPLEIVSSNRFLKDVARAKKRGKNLSCLADVLRKLASGEKLENKYRHHKLTGNFKDRWECHIEADWLLIYLKTSSTIICERIGTHSDLFE
jgi:mRNA interferase YafQ